VVHRFDFELRQHAIEQRLVHDRADKLALHHPRQPGFERIHVERHDGLSPVGRQVGDQSVADLSARARNKCNWFPNH